MNTPERFNPQPPRPAWGIRPPTKKLASMQLPILRAPVPDEVVIPIHQCLDLTAHAIVTVGQRVRTGEPIAETIVPPGSGRPPKLHASISGEVLAIEPRPVPAPLTSNETCVVIRGDGLDEPYSDCGKPADPLSMDPATLCELIAEAGIVGLGGALFSTAAKLRTKQTVHALIVNGAECEPYITCDEILQRERADTILAGTRIMMRALQTQLAVIAVESDMPAARVALYDAIKVAGDDNIRISVVTAKYPAGGERQLIQLIMGQEVPEHGYPDDIGYVCQNVATVAAVADFFNTGRPLISRIVTLTGGGVEAPRNVEARIGTIISALIEATVGYTDRSSRLIMGGPMMGVLLPSHDLPVTKATNCLIVAGAADISPLRPEMPCIRCSECSQVCPAQLLPQELLTAAHRQDMEALDTLGLGACIECGCCDYVCPSGILMTARFIAAKRDLRQHEAAVRGAAHARARFENREQRLQKKRAERDHDLQEQVDELADPQTIEAVMARVKSRRDPE